jgi:hypothetical protein
MPILHVPQSSAHRIVVELERRGLPGRAKTVLWTAAKLVDKPRRGRTQPVALLFRLAPKLHA